MGIAAVGFFVVIAAVRDGVAWVLPLAVSVVALSGVAAVTLGFVVVRHLHARSTLLRVWATVGAGLAIALALLIVLD